MFLITRSLTCPSFISKDILFKRYLQMFSRVLMVIWRHNFWCWWNDSRYKIWISREENINFSWNKKILRLCPKDYILLNWWIFLFNCWPTKSTMPYFQPRQLSEIPIITNFQHATSRIWTIAEPELRFHWMKKLWRSDNSYTTVPLNFQSLSLFSWTKLLKLCY